MDMVATNVRHPRDFLGDLRAMLGSARVGERRLLKLVDEYGIETATAAVGEVLDSAERQSRACIREWKDGVYRGLSILDDDGHGIEDIKLRATVTKKGDSLDRGPDRVRPAGDRLRQLLVPEHDLLGAHGAGLPPRPAHPEERGHLPPRRDQGEAGHHRLAVPAGAGDARHQPLRPGDRRGRHQGAQRRLPRSRAGRLVAALPHRDLGQEPADARRPFIWHLFHARGGGGASSAGDGWETAGEGQAAGGIKFGSVEVAEARFPLFFERHEFRPDSFGDGQFRGGVGSVLTLRMETTEPAKGNTAGDGVRHPSYGILGGKDGLPHRYVMVAGGKRRVLKTKEVGIPIPPGAVFDIVSAGGGGWGKPSRRTPRALAPRISRTAS